MKVTKQEEEKLVELFGEEKFPRNKDGTRNQNELRWQLMRFHWLAMREGERMGLKNKALEDYVSQAYKTAFDSVP